ncbi:protein PNS1 [Carex littledalei]|uniref:Choline transporter-like protein n=1 Tax=Carex littledalei TaxID=544730 RepID=A0A833V0Y9_9POAL|nr:protein PNS1 [Carex littledalei]
MGSSDEAELSISATEQPLLSSSTSYSEQYPAPIAYTHSPRPIRDLPFLLLFLLLTLSTFAIGFLSLARRNPDKTLVSSFRYNPSLSSCVLSHLQSPPPLTLSPFLEYLIPTLIITLLLLPAITFSLLFLLRHYAKHLIYSLIPFFFLTPSFLNAYWFVACAVGASCHNAFPLTYRIVLLVFVFLLIGVIIWIIVSNWHRIELTVQIVQVSAVALAENIALLSVLPVLLFLYALIYFTPVVFFLVFATWNGKVVPRAHRGFYECVWREAKWVQWYFALAVIMLLWSAATMVEAQVYVISGTVAQWYFTNDSSRRKKSLRSSLSNAFGPSFGTVSFSGMVMGAVRLVRTILDAAKQNRELGGCVNLILKCCADFLLSAFDFVNKFTVNFAAITGEAYCSSAKMTYELLKRNLLSAVFVETISTRLLAGIIFVISSVYAILVYAILRATSALGTELYLIASLTWLLLMVVLGYFVYVLDNVVDAVYICYAIDRDRGDVSKDHIHQIFAQLPKSRNHGSSLV